MPKTKYRISEFVTIRNSRIMKGKNSLFQMEHPADLHEFLRISYHHLKLSYPKFHKMDKLCKLGILATEVLFQGKDISKDTALVLSNSTSSLETDKKHRDSIDDVVSPAIFVYTLPNIVSGEISIRHQLQSENAFFIEEEFNPQLLLDYTEDLLETGKAAAVVCGWIDLDNDEYDVFLSLISTEGEIPLSAENLEQLYLFENE